MLIANDDIDGTSTSGNWDKIDNVNNPEADPVFLASIAAGISAGDMSNWDTAYNRVNDNANKALYFRNNSGAYYNASAVDALLTNKSNVGHAHDARYYTKTLADARYLQAESDPQVGSLTNGKRCRSDGTSVICDQDTPTG